MSERIEFKENASRRPSRRPRLKQSSTVLAGSALTGAIAARAYAAGDETIKVALVGCGGRGTGAATQALSTKGPVKLWAMADVFKDKIESSLAALTKGQKSRYDRKEHQGFAGKVDVAPQRRFVGFDAYKQAIDSGVDLVILTTYPHFRPMQYEYAVKQGKNVFMEKPVATDASGIRRLLAANEEAKKKNLKVAVGLQRHHHAAYQETMKRLKDGAIGDFELIRVYWDSGWSGGCGLCPAGMTEMQFQLRTQYYFCWISGDHIVEQHVHNIDIAQWLRDEHPISAQGQGGRMYRNGREHGDIFDHHFVEFTYPDGTRMFSQCRHIPGCWNSVSEHILGSKGKAEVNRGIIETADGRWRCRAKVANPYQVEHDVLFDAVRNNKPHNEAEYGALSTMAAIMGRMATYSGKQINWDEAINSKISLAPEKYSWDAKPPVVPGPDGVYQCAVPGVTKVI